MKVTGDTITDEQIHELREEAWEIYAESCRALGFSPHGGKIDADEKREARYACAEIVNDRMAAMAVMQNLVTPPGKEVA